MPLPMYLVEYLGVPRNHHALYVEIDKTTEAGQLLHVTGTVQSGMTFVSKATDRLPEFSNSYVSQTLLGWVSSSDLSKIEKACKSNPPPAKQFNGPKRIDPKKPLRRCQEWTAETIKLLEKKGLLRREGQGGSSAASSSSRAGGSSSHSSSRAGGSSRHSSSTATSEPRDGETSSDGYWIWSAKYGNWYHNSRDGSTIWASQGKGRA